MSGWRLIPASAFRAMPWRNGGGTTWEIAQGRMDGAADGDWHWRFSLAEIAADGPFSAFPHIDRMLTVVDGAGITLKIDRAPPRLLRPGDAIRFPGEAAVGCTLLAGPSRDLNVMVDRRVARLVPGGAETLMSADEGGLLALYACEEVVLESEAGRMVVVAGDALIGSEGVRATVTHGRAFGARIERLAPR